MSEVRNGNTTRAAWNGVEAGRKDSKPKGEDGRDTPKFKKPRSILAEIKRETETGGGGSRGLPWSERV